MLSEIELNTHLHKLGVTPAGVDLIKRVRSSPPVRRVRSSRSNVSGRFASDKMRLTIQAESRNVEYPFILEKEVDPDTFEVWDQPASLKLTYQRPDGKRGGHRTVVDFLTISRTAVDFWECKDLKQLEKLEEQNPNIFCRSPDGMWISPAGIEAAKPFGIGHRIYTPNSSDIIYARNISFALDYFRQPIEDPENILIDRVVNLLNEYRVLNLNKLYELAGDRLPVNLAIAHARVFVNWKEKLLCYPEQVDVYSSASIMEAHSIVSGERTWQPPLPVEVKEGVWCEWNSRQWQILNLSNKVNLQAKDRRLVTISFEDFKGFIDAKEIVFTSIEEIPNSNALELLMGITDEDLSEALTKQKILRRWNENDRANIPVTDRTIRNWKVAAAEGELRYGSAFLGLVSNNRLRGNRESRLTKYEEEVLNESFEVHLETSTSPNWKWAHTKYKTLCEEKGITPCSYPTYKARGEKRDKPNQVLQREGIRAANQINIPNASEDVFDNTMPTHGDRPWEVAHVDHTLLDIELISAITGQNLGRPWLSLLVDAFSRFILAFWLTFESPSHRAVMALTRQCVERWSRLPQRLIMDGGKEFESVYTESLFARYYVDTFQRPAGQPRYGSPVERVFGCNDTRLIHNLVGNTEKRKLLRSLSSTHDPSDLAIWTPEKCYELMGEWVFDVYPNLAHHGIAEHPKDRFDRSVIASGARPFRHIPYDMSFYISTLPEVDGRTRKVRRSTIKIHYLEYRGVEKSLGPYNGQNVLVRQDPYDISRAWVFVDGQWVMVFCTHDLVRQYVERGITIAQIELSARLTLIGKEYRNVEEVLKSFVASLEAQEKLLLSQKQASMLPDSVNRTQERGCPAILPTCTETPMPFEFID